MAGIDEINQRRETLQTIIKGYREERKRYTIKDLLKDLSDAGYDTNERTLHRDLQALRANDNFVLRIATDEYSAMVADCFGKWGEIETDLEEMIKQKWTANKTVKKQVAREDGIIELEEETITEEVAGPKLQASKLLADIQKMKLEAFNGKLLDEATALMLKEYQKLKKENEVLKEQLNIKA